MNYKKELVFHDGDPCEQVNSRKWPTLVGAGLVHTHSNAGHWSDCISIIQSGEIKKKYLFPIFVYNVQLYIVQHTDNPYIHTYNIYCTVYVYSMSRAGHSQQL